MVSAQDCRSAGEEIKMSNEMINALNKLAEKFGIVIDWTSDNLAPYLTDLYGRIVTYNRFIYTAGEIFGLVVMIICGVLIYRMYKRAQNNYDREYEVFEFTVSLIAALVLFFTVMFMLSFLGDTISAWILPEKLILQMLAY